MIPPGKFVCCLVTVLSGLLLPACDYESEKVQESEHTLLFPNEGETLIQGNSYLVKWSDDLSSSLRVRLLKSGNIYVHLAEMVPNTGEFAWTVPDTIEESTDYSIKLLSNNDDFVYFESARRFKILKRCDTASFTDPRDGQVYGTVKLAGRWWMAQNLNYDTPGSWCYANDLSECSEMGRLYTNAAARNACPPGWHLPTDDEWQTLEAYLGIHLEDINTRGLRGINAGYLLTSKEGIGFNALFAGYMNTRSKMFYSLNQSTYFWTSSFDKSEGNYWVRQLFSYSGKIERTSQVSTYNAFSVRYIRDRE